jgi:hypothetical protein
MPGGVMSAESQDCMQKATANLRGRKPIVEMEHNDDQRSRNFRLARVFQAGEVYIGNRDGKILEPDVLWRLP